MKDREKRELYKRTIKTYGADSQMFMAVEEMAELTQAISKFKRGRESNMEEEIADVHIMMGQLEELFDKKKIDEWEDMKLKRLKERLDGREVCR